MNYKPGWHQHDKKLCCNSCTLEEKLQNKKVKTASREQLFPNRWLLHMSLVVVVKSPAHARVGPQQQWRIQRVKRTFLHLESACETVPACRVLD